MDDGAAVGEGEQGEVLMGITAEIKAAMKAAAKKATPGPWFEGDRWVFVPPANPEENPSHPLRNVLEDEDGVSGVPEAQNNAAFIAIANPANVLAILAENEALAARVAELETASRRIVPYLTWTVGSESPGHHPTMPSAVEAFREAVGADALRYRSPYRTALKGATHDRD